MATMGSHAGLLTSDASYKTMEKQRILYQQTRNKLTDTHLEMGFIQVIRHFVYLLCWHAPLAASRAK